MLYDVGVDLGGTYIKAGIVNKKGEIIKKEIRPTKSEEGKEKVIENILDMIIDLGGEKANVVGVCVPGVVDEDKGICKYSGNLNWKNVNLKKELEKKLNKEIKIKNDVRAALLAEKKYGIGKICSNWVLLTLGTGIGGGIIFNDLIISGNQNKGAEFGHMVLKINGEQCTCGRKGCFEAYASSSGLIRITKRLIEQYPDSITAKLCKNNGGKADGTLAFVGYRENDKCAKIILEEYISYLVEGILNVCNIIRPELVVLGGGLSNNDDILIPILNDKIRKQKYGYEGMPEVTIAKAILGNDAGIIGAVLEN